MNPKLSGIKKHFPKLVMTVAMLLSFLPASATYFVADGIYYYITDATNHEVEVAVPGSEGEYSGNINIPSTVTIEGTAYSVTSIGWFAFSSCHGLTSVSIPNSVTSIGLCAFSDCTGLTSVTIPNSVTSIGRYAFYKCSGLTSVTIPNSVTSIGTSAFSGCTGLTSVTIGNSVTSIGSLAFCECKCLTNITLPNSITSIGYQAFQNCTGLTSIIIPNSVTAIEQETFRRCTGLTSVTIPNSVTSIGLCAFQDCIGLTSVDIPNSVTSIGSYAFRNCTGLTSVTIPSSVTSIGNYAFGNCPIKSVYCHWKEPISSTDDIFSSKCYEEGTLYVPKGSANKYKSTDPWSRFWHIEESDNLGVEDIMENQPTGDYIVYDLQGVLVLKTADMDEVKQLPSGLYIVNGKKMIIR